MTKAKLPPSFPCAAGCQLVKITPASLLILCASAAIVAALGFGVVAIALAATAAVMAAAAMITKVMEVEFQCPACS